MLHESTVIADEAWGTGEAEPYEPDFYESSRWKRSPWLPTAMVIAGLLAVVLVTISLLHKSNKAAYITGKVERGTIHQVVEATGTINAVTTVQVGSQVSGTIAKLYVDFNSQVHKGQLIAQIDPALLRGTLLQAQADLANARASLASAQAEVIRAQALAIQTKADFERTRALVREGISTPQQFDQAKANADSSQATVDSLQAQVKQSAAQIEQKQAAAEAAATNLAYTQIKAPVDGVVIARSVDVGQTVAASFQAPTLFSIAADLTKMQLDCQVDESDVSNIHVGQEVMFKVDAFPKEVFRGLVKQVRLNPTTVQNVVTYDAVIDFDNLQRKLFPGMTAYVTVPVKTAEDVLTIPNRALHFKPDLPADRLQILYRNFGIDSSRLSGNTISSHDGVVWKLRPDRIMEPVVLSLGITDYTRTEVVETASKRQLSVGDQLVLGNEVPTHKNGGAVKGGGS